MRLLSLLIPVIFFFSSPCLAKPRSNPDSGQQSLVSRQESDSGPPIFYTVMSLTPGIDSSRVNRYIDSGYILASNVVSQNQKTLGLYSFHVVVIEFTTSGTSQVLAGTYRVAFYTTFVNDATFTAFLSPYTPTTDIDTGLADLEIALESLFIHVPTVPLLTRQNSHSQARRRLGVADLDILGRGLSKEGKSAE